MGSRGPLADRDELFTRLLETSILERDGDWFILSPAFEDERERQQRRFEGLSAEERSDVIDRHLPELSVDVDQVGLETVRDGVAVREFAPEFTPAESLRIAFAISRVDDPPRDAGAPDGFTPLRAHEIPLFLHQHLASIVYVWQDDCDPCDDVRETLEGLIRDAVVDERVGLAAVSGENRVEYLYNQYDVGFVPTTLFCVGDRVDSRLLGAKRRPIFEQEASIIQESLPGPRSS